MADPATSPAPDAPDAPPEGPECALCGKAGATYHSPVAVYSGGPGGEWLCAEGSSDNPSSREAWACYRRYQRRP